MRDREIAEKILLFEYQKDMTLGEIQDWFVSLMKEYQIDRYTRVGNGLQGDNFEWTLYKILFLDSLVTFFELDFLLNF